MTSCALIFVRVECPEPNCRFVLSERILCFQSEFFAFKANSLLSEELFAFGAKLGLSSHQFFLSRNVFHSTIWQAQTSHQFSKTSLSIFFILEELNILKAVSSVLLPLSLALSWTSWTRSHTTAADFGFDCIICNWKRFAHRRIWQAKILCQYCMATFVLTWGELNCEGHCSVRLNVCPVRYKYVTYVALHSYVTLRCVTLRYVTLRLLCTSESLKA